MMARIIPRLHRRRAETKNTVSGNAHYTYKKHPKVFKYEIDIVILKIILS